MLKTTNFMTQNVITISREDNMLNAYKLMCDKKIRHLPVTDADGVVIGMLSDRDVQRAMVVDREKGSQFAEIILSDAKKVSGFMTPVAFTAIPETSLADIVEKMMALKISAVIIVDESQKCIGIVTSNDVMRVFLEHIERNRELFEKPVSFFLPNTLY